MTIRVWAVARSPEERQFKHVRRSHVQIRKPRLKYKTITWGRSRLSFGFIRSAYGSFENGATKQCEQLGRTLGKVVGGELCSHARLLASSMKFGTGDWRSHWLHCRDPPRACWCEAAKTWKTHATSQRATQRNATQHNATQRNTTQHNTTQHNATRQNTTQRNTTQRNKTRHNATQHNATFVNILWYKIL